MIIYKGQQMTVREACALMNIDCDDFMAWCKKFALQNYGYALNYYKRTLKHGKKQDRITVQPGTPLDAKRTISGIGLGVPDRKSAHRNMGFFIA